MKRHLTLHIGLSKTGSSSIQRVLAEQRPAMEALGVYYPRSPGWANHALLPASLVRDPAILWGFHPATWEGMTPAARLARFRTEWEAEMAALPAWAAHVVISAEQIGGLLRSDAEVQRLADLLAPLFESIVVVAYLRRQDQHVASAYSQHLRGGVMEAPALPEGGPEAHYEYDYGTLLGRYAAAFGDATMRVRIFARGSLAGGDVVEDFLSVAGFSLPVPDEAPNKTANVSISLEGQALMLAAGRRMAAACADESWRDQPPWRRFAESVSERFAGRGWRPARADAEAFMARFAATNEQARARYFPQLETLFPLDFSDLPERAEVAGESAVMQAAIDLAIHEMAHSAQREAEAAMARYRLLKKLDERGPMRVTLVRAIKFAPDLLQARLALAELYIEDGDRLQAGEHLDVAERIAPDAPKLRNLRRRLQRLGAAAA